MRGYVGVTPVKSLAYTREPRPNVASRRDSAQAGSREPLGDIPEREGSATMLDTLAYTDLTAEMQLP
jgi:hypothetical protein